MHKDVRVHRLRVPSFYGGRADVPAEYDVKICLCEDMELDMYDNAKTAVFWSLTNRGREYEGQLLDMGAKSKILHVMKRQGESLHSCHE